MTCVAEGIPVPTVTWMHNNREITYSGDETYTVRVIQSTDSVTSVLAVLITVNWNLLVALSVRISKHVSILPFCDIVTMHLTAV